MSTAPIPQAAITPVAGQPAWLFDENRRVYAKPTDVSFRAPIYAEHWREVTIESAPKTGSYAIVAGRKLVRDGRGVYRGHVCRLAFDRAEVDADIWIHTHRHNVIDMVGRCADVAALKQIAALVGYAGSKETP